MFDANVIMSCVKSLLNLVEKLPFTTSFEIKILCKNEVWYFQESEDFFRILEKLLIKKKQNNIELNGSIWSLISHCTITCIFRLDDSDVQKTVDADAEGWASQRQRVTTLHIYSVFVQFNTQVLIDAHPVVSKCQLGFFPGKLTNST